MKRTLVLCMLLAAGCGQCTTPPPAPPPVVDSDEPELPDVLKPGRIYRDAYERAKQQITADNAADRLDAIERDIDLEGGARDATAE